MFKILALTLFVLNAQYLDAFPYDVWGEKLGCYVNNVPLAYKANLTASKQMNLNLCWNHCYNLNYNHSAVYDSFCFCTNQVLTYTKSAVESDCNKKCDGNNQQICGGRGRFSLYSLHEMPANILRYSAKNLDQPDSYIFNNGYGNWAKTTSNRIDTEFDEVTRSDRGILAYSSGSVVNSNKKLNNKKSKQEKYVYLAEDYNLLFYVDSPNSYWINSVWDIVWAADVSNVSVAFYRKSNCVWVENLNGKITNEYRFVSYVQATQDLLLFNAVKRFYVRISPDGSYKGLTRVDTTQAVYPGQWYNVNVLNLVNSFNVTCPIV